MSYHPHGKDWRNCIIRVYSVYYYILILMKKYLFLTNKLVQVNVIQNKNFVVFRSITMK